MVERRRTFVSRNAAATEALGEALGRALPAGAVVALHGEMGTGKTTLVRGLARGLGVEGPVTSPTFVLMQEYEGRERLFHFDAWMEGREALFLEGGGADYLGGDGVAVIEWAERVDAYLPRPHLALHLRHQTAADRAEGDPGEHGERHLFLEVVTGARAGALDEALAGVLTQLAPQEGLQELAEAAGGPKGRGDSD